MTPSNEPGRGYRAVRAIAWRGAASTTRWYWPGRRALLQLRRRMFVARVRLLALARDAVVELDVAADVEIGRRLTINVAPHTESLLTIGAASRVENGVTLWLRGGTVELGEDVELRRGCTLVSSGILRVGDGAMVGWGATLHCASDLRLGPRSVIAEYATITDSRHLRTPLDVNLLHHVATAPTSIGEGCWIGAHAVVVHGVTVGDGAFVGGGAVVTSDVEPSWLVAGNPAVPIRELCVEETE